MEKAMMPTRDWAMKARYIPGQVWAAPGVPRADVNPRPLHKDVPDNGLIGCYSHDDKHIFATAWEPARAVPRGWQMSPYDFRLGGINPGGTLEPKAKFILWKTT